MAESNTAWLLADWALWIGEGGKVDLRSKGTLCDVVPSQRDDFPPCSSLGDAEALRVDAAMAKLRIHSIDWYKVLWLTFVCDYSDRRVAAHFEITRHSAIRLYQEAYCWMDAELNPSISNVA